MFEDYKNRMANRAKTVGEMLRLQSNMVIEHTWERDPNARKVYVVRVDSGLPEVTAEHELIDVKFNVKTYSSITSDEPSYWMQFRHGEEIRHPEISIGSYVYMEDEDGEWKWWLLVHLDERPTFRQWQCLECNWVLKWIYNNAIYNCLGIQRIQQSYNSGSWDADRTTAVDNVTAVWVPTNDDTLTIGYNHRFIISDKRRYPPLVYQVSKLEDTQPIGLTKFKFTQETFDPIHDNPELMICDYYRSSIIPSETNDDIAGFEITYNGTKPTVKVGGSAKVFTAQLPADNHFDIQWSLVDGDQIYGGSYENSTVTYGDYTITTEDRTMKLEVASNYSLIGTKLIVKAHCADGSDGQIEVEVIG